MNTFVKYMPNVFLAKCTEKHEKGSEVILHTKYGKEVEVEIYNLICEKDGFYFYSFQRTDGFNSQERAKRRAEKLSNYQQSAINRAAEWRKKANEGKDFLILAEPIKIGHHSEKRHRALIQRNHDRMQNWYKESQKALSYDDRIWYWEKQAEKIDLSMIESIDYFEAKLEKAKELHQFYKDNPAERKHSFSLTYAKKDINEFQKKYETALKLWGDNE